MGLRRGEHADLPAAARAGGPFRADPEVVAALAEAGVPALSEPTLGAGETAADLLADPALDTVDPDALGRRGYGFVRLHQLVVEHLAGAR